MFSLLFGLFQLLLLCFLIASFLLWIFFFGLAWSWAQSQGGTSPSFREILALASVEWAAFLSLNLCRLFRIRKFHEAPPARDFDASPRQLPIIFVPSLHTGPEIFHFLHWRLRKRYWNSLWPFEWRSFLSRKELLEDNLAAFIEQVIAETQARRFRIISFGSSFPIVRSVLAQESLKAYCDHWIAISSPQEFSRTMQLLSSQRVRDVYEKGTVEHENIRKPDLLVVGQKDLICYPEGVWSKTQRLNIAEAGHFTPLLHSATTERCIQELSETD